MNKVPEEDEDELEDVVKDQDRKPPANFTNMGCIMSNLDHEIQSGAEQWLKKNKAYGEYPASNFFATVWFDRKEKLFKSRVQQYHECVEVISKPSLSKIMAYCIDKYGGD